MVKKIPILVLVIACVSIPLQSHAFLGDLVNQLDKVAKEFDEKLQIHNKNKEKMRNGMVGYCGNSWVTGVLARDQWEYETKVLVANPKKQPYMNSMDFSNACRSHDSCYGTIGKSKEKCDLEFIDDMQTECRKISKQFAARQNKFCHEISAVYFNLVKAKGQESYNRAQKEARITGKKEFKFVVNTAQGRIFKEPVTGIEFVFVSGGSFKMGSNSGLSDEKPVHQVSVGNFWMGKYEVTQGQWQKVMGTNPSKFSNCGSNCPVENVSYYDVQKFIDKLHDGRYRLPTEAEWEFACRSGGRNEKYCGGSDADFVASYNTNSTRRVGSKRQNGLGLYDMSGNVWEWTCSENGRYKHDFHKNCSKRTSRRMARGGGWDSKASGVRSASRSTNKSGTDSDNLGFRLVRKP